MTPDACCYFQVKRRRTHIPPHVQRLLYIYLHMHIFTWYVRGVTIACLPPMYRYFDCYHTYIQLYMYMNVMGRLRKSIEGLLGRLGSFLVASWAVLVASWWPLGPSWVPLGCLLGATWAVLVASWAVLVASWARPGAQLA